MKGNDIFIDRSLYPDNVSPDTVIDILEAKNQSKPLKDIAELVSLPEGVVTRIIQNYFNHG